MRSTCGKSNWPPEIGESVFFTALIIAIKLYFDLFGEFFSPIQLLARFQSDAGFSGPILLC